MPPIVTLLPEEDELLESPGICSNMGGAEEKPIARCATAGVVPSAKRSVQKNSKLLTPHRCNALMFSARRIILDNLYRNRRYLSR